VKDEEVRKDRKARLSRDLTDSCDGEELCGIPEDTADAIFDAMQPDASIEQMELAEKKLNLLNAKKRKHAVKILSESVGSLGSSPDMVPDKAVGMAIYLLSNFINTTWGRKKITAGQMKKYVSDMLYYSTLSHLHVLYHFIQTHLPGHH